MQLSLSHLGYRPGSPKTVTLMAPPDSGIPEIVPFYIRQNCFRMPRDVKAPEGFSKRFPAPYDLLRGRLIPEEGTFFYRGELHKMESRWGTVWQGNFSDFREAGSYQIETDVQVSPPFMIGDRIYDRLVLGYLNFLRAQRCGVEVYGVHSACHLDDGILDTDGSPWPVAGGWHDAGDFRKWLAFTQEHLGVLAALYERLGPPLPLIEEIAWGNRFFHGMITQEGQVYEDVGGGSASPGTSFTYDEHWWFENHPGCYGDASDNRWTDNRPGSGDERRVRTAYNPLVQFSFVSNQMRVARILPDAEGDRCRELAQTAWDYAQRRGHDRRTLFVTAELCAALEMEQWNAAETLAQELLGRQDQGESNAREKGGSGLRGYFMERDGTDAFRSFAFAADPPLALLRLLERSSQPGIHGDIHEAASRSVQLYIEDYLLADASSNPFGLTPYGIYLNPPAPERQTFRDAGRGRGVRTFIHPFNSQGIVHGTGSVLMSHAHLLARAGRWFGRSDWQHASERLLQWALGHNTLNRSLFTGIGYRQPVGYSFRIAQLPETLINGFIGRPDDTPYLEESSAIEWNTLEYWSVPHQHALYAVAFLKRGDTPTP